MINYFEPEEENANKLLVNLNNLLILIKKTNAWIDANLSDKEKLAICIKKEKNSKNEFESLFESFTDNLKLNIWLQNIIDNHNDRAKNALKDQDVWDLESHKPFYKIASILLELTEGNLEKAIKLFKTIRDLNQKYTI